MNNGFNFLNSLDEDDLHEFILDSFGEYHTSTEESLEAYIAGFTACFNFIKNNT